MSKECKILRKIRNEKSIRNISSELSGIKNGVTEAECGGVEWINLVKDKGPVAYYSGDRGEKLSVSPKGNIFLPLVCCRNTPAPLAIRYSAMAGF